jgi:uncharacterized membrane protein
VQPQGPSGEHSSPAEQLLPPEVFRNLPAQLQEALKVPGAQAQLLSFIAPFGGWWSSPYPPPELLRGYEEVQSGTADRILGMVDNQQKHRHELEKTTVVGASKRAWWGLWLGFIISLVVLGLGTMTILEGFPWAGGGVMGADLVALAGVFVIGQFRQSRERVEKDAQTRQPPRIFGPLARH